MKKDKKNNNKETENLDTMSEQTVDEIVEKKIIEEYIDYKDMALRAQADYKNLQIETAKQRGQWAQMSEWQILEEFIPIYDNFKKATAHRPESDDTSWKNWADGVGFIMKQFADILKSHGVEELKTVGESFDATKHESVGEEDSDETHGIILREVESGYEKGGKILRVAKVIIAK